MGERFGEYEIEGRLGAGGMAEVYVARRAGPEGFVKRVCLKRVLADVELDRDAVAQFHDEARLCAHLHHPAIAGVHELGQVDGKWFMAMELVDGMDLRSLVASLRARGATLPMDVALYVVRMVAEALAYAHALTIDGRPAGLVHRDVTPSNVLVSIHGEVKLADFGIARTAMRTHRTRSGVVKGKVPYMAPEQALGDTLDRRTDLFALGVVLYELLAGRRPHDGQTDLDTLTNAQRGKRPSLRESAPETPPEVVALVTRMLAARPEDRAGSADEVARVLDAIPTSRDPRRTLASLVDDARRTRSAAPATRIRGPRARVQVDGVRATPVDDGPTEIGGGIAPPRAETAERSESVVMQRPAPNRTVQFALGFTLAIGVGSIALVALLLALGGDRFSRAIADARTPAVTEVPAIDDALADEPKPPPATLVAPPIAAPAPPPPAEPVPTQHAHRRARPAPVVDTAPSLGRIQVVAVPFGDVELDGRSLGRAPLTTSVESGRHLVVVSNGGARVERHVTVDPGGTERIVVDLLEMH